MRRLVIAVLSLKLSLVMDNSGGKKSKKIHRKKRMGVIQREIHKLRHLEMVQHVDGKLEKQDSETETARDRKWSFD